MHAFHLKPMVGLSGSFNKRTEVDKWIKAEGKWEMKVLHLS